MTEQNILLQILQGLTPKNDLNHAGFCSHPVVSLPNSVIIVVF